MTAQYLLAGMAVLIALRLVVFGAPISDQTIPNPNLNSPNSVIAWNAFTTDHYYKAYAPQGAHQLADLTIAVHDALNTIDQRFDFYVGNVGAATNLSHSRINHASPDSAIAGVYTTLLPVFFSDLQLYRIFFPEYVFTADEVASLTAEVEAFSNSIIAAIRLAQPRLNDQQIADGFTIGAAAAQSILAFRSGDGHDRYQFYLLSPPSTFVGLWRDIGSNPMAYAQFGDIKPYAVSCVSNYLAPPPPALNSTAFIQDMFEVISKGTDGTGLSGVISTTTPQEDQIGYWFAGIGLDKLTNYVLQSLITRDYPEFVNDLWATARLFALVQIATIDSIIVNQQNKRIHNFWGPQQALVSRPAVPDPLGYPTDQFGNHILSFNDFRVGAFCPQLQCWNPNVPISPTSPTAVFSGIEPNTPEYPAGLSTQVAAGGAIAAMVLQLGSDQIFPGGSLSVQYGSPDPLNFSTITELNNLSVNGSIFAGQHIRTSGNAGITQGNQVALEVFSNVLKPHGGGRGDPQPRGGEDPQPSGRCGRCGR